MRVSQKSLALSEQIGRQIETRSWRIEFNRSSFVFEAGSGETVVLEGELFYYMNANDEAIRFASDEDVCTRLKRLYDSVGQEGLPESAEGMYHVAVVNEMTDAVTIFGDAYNRVNLFYCIDRECPIVSTEYRDVISHFGRIEYDPAVSYCLLILGYPPSKHTPYRGLRRLDFGERLLLQNNGVHLVKAEARPLLSQEMGDADLDRYGEILENAVLSRSSQTENWVELSGWDSTVILGVLRKHFDAAKVGAVATGGKYRDGTWGYVVKESIELGKHYGVPVEFVEYSLADKRLPNIWSDGIQNWLSHFIYDPPLGYLTMANVIKKKGKPGAAAFIGSFSDSIHDFAFSHFASLPYLSYDFRNYDGKMRAYLYSPSFLKKVLDNTFEDDFVYRLFRWHYSKVRVTDVSLLSRNERVFEYLLAFLMSNFRLPFASIATESIFSSNGITYFKEWLWDNYFKDAVERIDGSNMYFWLIRLYQHFHLQGFEKNAQDICFEGSGKVARQPYYDLRLIKFTQMMPENWGRGLEWRPGKYPLKHYGREIGVPYELLESISHMPTTAPEPRRNAYLEIVNNSTLTSTVWPEVKRNKNLNEFFDKDWFNINALQDTLQTGQSESPAFPLRLLMLLSNDVEGR